MAKTRLQKIRSKLLSSLSFSAELRKMRRELNAKIDQPESIAPPPPFHPQAASRWFKRRRITIAESYLTVVRDLDSRHSSKRLEALKKLAEGAFHSTNIDYPLNTARVQSALVKEVVKHRSNKRRQLELLYDFSMSTRGQHQVIRKLCDELNIIELPEKGMEIGELGFGWDGHVHDTATSGRKNPTQLVIDAFIKGISSLTVAYGSPSDIEMMEEVLEAGAILGLRVDIGLEFSVIVEGLRYHFMAELPHFPSASAMRSFFPTHASDLASFFEGLDANRENRLDAVRRILESFNQTTIVEINKGFEDKKEYCLPPMSLDELLTTIPNVNITPLHLAEFMYMKYRPILQRRVWYYKVMREKLRQETKSNAVAATEKLSIDAQYSKAKKELNGLSPDSILSLYFDDPHIISYQTVFDDIEKLSEVLRAADCRIKFIHPLEFGLDNAQRVVMHWGHCLDSIEIYNTQDCTGRDPSEIETFARFVNNYNSTQAFPTGRFLKPVCGSDATGRNPKIPGMGFVFEDRITGALRQKYIKRHLHLPPFVSAMIRAENAPIDALQWSTSSSPQIISMGKVSSGEGYTSTSDDEKIGPLRAWRYSNPLFKNTIRTLIGYFIAMSYIGPGYAFLWLGITGFRNSIADLISHRGTKLNQWKLQSINFDNVAQSLFWTGFSVPLMGFAKQIFDGAWPWTKETFIFNLSKFFIISMVNGFYLAAHNTLRGFDKNVVRANIFRSILAWPLATVFAPLGNALFIPSIVQTKIWSDFVAGFIEGGDKYRKVLRQRQKTLEEIIPTIIHSQGAPQYAAMLDILYLFSHEPRTQTTIKAILSPYVLFRRKLKKNSSLRLGLLSDLYACMSDDDIWTNLVDYIVSNYDEEMADDLVDLVADELRELQDELSELIKKYSKTTKLQAIVGNIMDGDKNASS